jgi:hypothetical protein
MRRLRSLVLAAACASISTGCFQSHGLRRIEGSDGHAWRGTGRASASEVEIIIGLTEQLRQGPSFRHAALLEVVRSGGAPEPLFAEPYYLTSFAQSSSSSTEEQTWLHAEIAGRTDSLTLFATERLHLTTLKRITAIPDTGILDEGGVRTIRRICGMAGVDRETEDPGPLYLSVIACRHADTDCAAGVVEAEIDFIGGTWRVRNPVGAQQATVRRPDGTPYPAECMPIATTGRGYFSKHYVALVVPSSGEIVVHRAGQLHVRAAGRLLEPAEGRAHDIVFLRNAEALSYLAVLWKSANETLIKHYTLLNLDSPERTSVSSFHAEVVPHSIHFIESPGHPYDRSSSLRQLYLFAPESVYVSEYDLEAR